MGAEPAPTSTPPPPRSVRWAMGTFGIPLPKGARNAPFLLFDQNFNESVLNLKSGILRDGVGL